MKHHESHKHDYFLKQFDTKELDDLMASILREMRRRDSEHVKGDVINGTHTLRQLRGTSKLP